MTSPLTAPHKSKRITIFVFKKNNEPAGLVPGELENNIAGKQLPEDATLDLTECKKTPAEVPLVQERCRISMWLGRDRMAHYSAYAGPLRHDGFELVDD